MADDVALTGSRILFAIAGRRLIEVRYSGATRIAEPHDYGVQNGREQLLVFQLSGPARPGKRSTSWRRLDLPKIEGIKVLDGTFAGSRGSSHAHHYHWDILYARVK